MEPNNRQEKRMISIPSLQINVHRGQTDILLSFMRP
jgi:hypothetical protein